jgi:hypothetical protein
VKLGNKALTYTAVLIGVYLITARATGFGTALGAGGKFYTGAVKTLQGR